MRTATSRTASALAEAQRAHPDRLATLQQVAARYAVAITPAIADLIDPSDPHDPIARQFVPDARELDVQPTESRDPIGDDAFSPVEGVVHRSGHLLGGAMPFRGHLLLGADQ